MKQKKKKKKKEKQETNDILIKNITIREIKTLFEQQQEEQDYYKPKRVSDFYNNYYI